VTRASAPKKAGGRGAGCWVPRTRNRRLARLPKRSRRTVRDAAGREARGRHFAEVGGTCCASRVSDTAEALYVLRCERPRGRNAARRADRVAGAREKRGSEKVPRAEAKPRKPFMRLGGAGLGSRVRPEVAHATAGRHRWTQLRAALHWGSPRGDGASEVRRLNRARRRTRSETFGRLTEASRFGMNRRLPTAWELR